MAKEFWEDDEPVAPKAKSEPKANGKPAAGGEFWKDDAPAAQNLLPEGVKPSTAGGGRGAVNPKAVTPSEPEPEPASDAEMQAASKPAGAMGKSIERNARPVDRRSTLERTVEDVLPSEESLIAQSRRDTRPQRSTLLTDGAKASPISKEELQGEGFKDSAMPVRAVTKAFSGAAKGIGGAAQAVGDVTGIDSLARAGKATAEGASAFESGMGDGGGPVAGFGPDSPAPYLGKMAEGAASSTAQSVAMAAGLGPKAVIPLMSIVSGGEQYNAARKAGKDPYMALVNAVPFGAFEAIGEKFSGLDHAMEGLKTLIRPGASDAAKRTAADALLRNGVRELPGEIVTYLGQTGVDLLPGIGLNPNLTMDQFLNGLRDTTVTALMQGGGMAAGGIVARQGVPAPQSDSREFEKTRGYTGAGESATQPPAMRENTPTAPIPPAPAPVPPAPIAASMPLDVPARPKGTLARAAETAPILAAGGPIDTESLPKNAAESDALHAEVAKLEGESDANEALAAALAEDKPVTRKPKKAGTKNVAQEAPTEAAPTDIKAEPKSDTAAQLDAVRDPASGKTAALITPNSSTDVDLAGLHTVKTHRGLFVTSDADVAREMATKAQTVSDEEMGKALGYTSTKTETDGTVVQARNAAGAVIHEEATNAENVAQAIDRAQEMAPTGSIVATTADEALARREDLVKKEADDQKPTARPADSDRGAKKGAKAKPAPAPRVEEKGRGKGDASDVPAGSDSGLSPSAGTSFKSVEEATDYIKAQRARGTSITAAPLTGADGSVTIAVKGTPDYEKALDQRQERLAVESRAKAGILDGDVLAASGSPFKAKVAAQKALKAAGDGHTIEPVTGGFVVRKAPNVSKPGDVPALPANGDRGGRGDAGGSVSDGVRPTDAATRPVPAGNPSDRDASATPAPADQRATPAVAPRRVTVAEQEVELTPAQAKAWDEADAWAAEERAKADADLESSKGRKQASDADVGLRSGKERHGIERKRIGMELSAKRRKIAGVLTEKEKAKEAADAGRMRSGDAVEFDLAGATQRGTVTGTAFGKVQGTLADGSKFNRPRAEVRKAAAEPAEPPQPKTDIAEAVEAAASTPLDKDIAAQGVNLEPTQAQAEAGNYKKAHVRVLGLDMTIENPKGSTRSGVSADGVAWSHDMSHAYGYVKGTEAADGDHHDVYLGPKAETAPTVYVIDQMDQKTGKFDETKSMVGFMSKVAAVTAYRKNFDKGWKVGPVTEMTAEEWKAFIADPARSKKPAGEVAAPVRGEILTNQDEQWVAQIEDMSDADVDALYKKAAIGSAKDAVAQREELRAADGESLFELLNEMDAAGEMPPVVTEDNELPGSDWSDGVPAHFKSPGKTINANKTAGEFIPTQEAAARLKEWKAEAKRQGKEEDHSNEVVISLFDASGEISKPWREAGYDVLQYDIQLGDDLMNNFPIADIMEIEARGKKVVGVIAQPPCTCFSASGARWWTERHDKHDRSMVNKMFGPKAAEFFSKPVEYTKMLVNMVDAVIDLSKPSRFTVMENPIGRIAKEANLPDPRMRFDPHLYGDPYTKRTQLWGDFNAELPTANVEPTLGSLMHKLWSRAEKDGGQRSLTPEGFAYAFFMANNKPTKAEIAKLSNSAISPDAGSKAAPADTKTDMTPGGKTPAPVEKGPDPAVQRAEFAAAEAKRKAKAAKLRAGAWEKNPMRAFLGRHGIPTSIAREWAPGTKERRAAMVPGYGPIFRADGLQLDMLAEAAVEEGFLTEPDVQQLESLITKVFAGERVVPQYAEGFIEAEAQAEMVARQEQYEDDAVDAASDPALWEHQPDAEEALDFIPYIEGDEDVAVENFLLSLGATKEEINEAHEASGRSESDDRVRAGDGPSAEESAQGSDGESGEGTDDSRDGGDTTEGLESPTREGLAAQEARAKSEEKKAAAKRQRDADRAQADAERGEFTLTGSDRPADVAAAAGQTDIFGAAEEPAAAPAAPAPAPEPKGKIEDFGERLDGARKMIYAEAFRDSMDKAKELDIATNPLSKTWPEPNYEKLLEGGADPWAVGFARAARDEVPTKPVKAWKLKGWVEQVKMLRSMMEKAMGDAETRDLMRAELAKERFNNLSKWVEGKTSLYMAVGHSQSLKSIELSSGSYGMYAGVKYDPPKVWWTVEEKRAGSSWGKELAKGDTREEAIAAYAATRNAAIEANGGKAPEPEKKRTTFEIYSKRGVKENAIFIGKKIGRNVVTIKAGFAKVAEARAYMADKIDELEATLAKMKDEPAERRETNEPRVGADHRNNGDVSPQEFQEAFGFRGVQFGNYVEGPRRQQDLNRAYDSLMDLAGMIGVPPRALSLNGTLGLAFGARGKGGKRAAAAHYEPGNVVINLTKESGAGSLAHEWWHAVDNYFGKSDGNTADNYPTEGVKVDGPMRAEMREAFRHVKRTLANLPMSERSGMLDAMRTKPYWGTGREMSARAFEGYVIAKLQDQGARNDYLANIVPVEAYNRPEAYPYPLIDELPAVRAAFDGFLGAVEHRTEPDGRVALFKVGDTDGRAVTIDASEEEQAQADALRRRLIRQHPNITTSFDFKAVEAGTPALRAKINHLRKTVKSLWNHDVRLVQFADGRGPFQALYTRGDQSVVLNIDANDPMAALVGHELLHAMRSASPDLYQELESRLMGMLNEGALDDHARALKEAYEVDGASLDDSVIVEELIADMVGDQFHKPEFWRKVLSMQEPLHRRIAMKIKGWLDDLLNKLRGKNIPEGPFNTAKYLKDVRAARDAIAEAMGTFAKNEADTRAYLDDINDTIERNESRMSVTRDIWADEAPSRGAREIALEGFYDKLAETYDEGFDPDEAFDLAMEEGSEAEKSVLRMLKKNDFLGFDYPHQAVQALIEEPSSFELSVPLKAALTRLANNPETRFSLTPGLKKFMEGSKVVNPDGSPMVVYRGGATEDWESGAEITSFRSKNGPWAGFFTNSKDVASRFANAQFSMTRHGGMPAGVFPVYLSMKRPLEVDASGKMAREFQIDASVLGKADHPIRGEMLNGSHDGLILRNTKDEGDVFVPLKPEQIKSATGNRGTYDPASPDIRFSIAKPTAAQQAATAPPVAKAAFEGATKYTRDEHGKAVTIEELKKRHAGLSQNDKAKMLLGARVVTEDQLKRWQASKLDIFDGAVNNRFEKHYYTPGVVWSDAELVAQGLDSAAIAAYRDLRSKADTSIAANALADILRAAGADGLAVRDQVMNEPLDVAAETMRDHLLNMADQFPQRNAQLIKAANKVIDIADEAADKMDGGHVPDIVKPTIIANPWDAPKQSKMDRIIYEMQDGKIDLKRTQENIEATGKVIEDQFNARLAETLYAGRVAKRGQNFIAHEAEPLIKEMASMGISQAELGDFLHARGAPERNAQIAKINPDMPDGGAGKNSKGLLLTTKAANDYIAAIPAARRAQFEKLAARVDSITKGTRELLVAEGLEKRETIDAWEGAYKMYVPMFREDVEFRRLTTFKRATGSESEAVNILAHVLMQREAAIDRAEKNRILVSLYGLALTNPNPTFWATIRTAQDAEAIKADLVRMGIDPAIAEAAMQVAPTITDVDPITNKVVERLNPAYKAMPGAIVLKVNGEYRVLMLNKDDERAMRMAAALKNKDGLTVMDIAGSVVGKTTRWLAAVNTQYNPAFGIVNFWRDTTGGLVHLTNTELRHKKAAVMAGLPGALRGIGAHLSGSPDKTKWSKLFEQFQLDGGQTGFRDLFKDGAARATQVEKELKKLTKSPLTPMILPRKLFRLLDHFNTITENAVRLSAYAAALDHGMSRPQAARLARELTVDFNRKGRTGREMGPLYAFFNASLQGTERTLRALRGPAGVKIIAGGLALGVVQALMLAAAGYDDDEIPGFVKARAFIIPLFDKEKRFISIPLPLGLHVLPNTGRIVTEMVIGDHKKLGAKAFDAIGEIAGAMNPMGGGNIFTADGALKTIAPTIIDPFIELTANKNFAGYQIERDATRESDFRPGHMRAKESTQRTATGQAYLGISKAVNTLMGGSDFEQGFVSPTPERIRYVAQVAGGGVLREFEKIVNTSAAKAAGQEAKLRDVPVVGRFTGEVEENSVVMSRYYKKAAEIDKVEGAVKAARKAGDEEATQRLMEKPEFELIKLGNNVARQLAKINKQAAAVVGDREQMKAIDEERAETMRKLTDSIEYLEKQQNGPTIADRLRVK